MADRNGIPPGDVGNHRRFLCLYDIRVSGKYSLRGGAACATDDPDLEIYAAQQYYGYFKRTKKAGASEKDRFRKNTDQRADSSCGGSASWVCNACCGRKYDEALSGGLDEPVLSGSSRGALSDPGLFDFPPQKGKKSEKIL